MEIKQEDGEMVVYFSNGAKLATLEYDSGWKKWQMVKLHGRPSGGYLIDLGKKMQKLDGATR